MSVARMRPASVRTLRALPTYLRIGFAEAIAYRAEFFVWILAYTMPLIMLALWTAVAREGPIGGFDERAFQAYFLTALVVRLLTGSWVVWEMNMDIRQGTLATRLLRPVHPFLSYACENLGAVPLRLVAIVPITGACLLHLGAGAFTHDPVQLAIVPVSIVGGWALWFLVMCTIGTLGLWWESSLSVADLWLGLYFVLSGYVMPLSLFPDWAQRTLKVLPFRSQLAFPVENAIGRLTRAESLDALGIQWAWVALALAVALVTWRRGVKRFAAFGG
jgi:ABC-2 type transport system permease protein